MFDYLENESSTNSLVGKMYKRLQIYGEDHERHILK